MSSPEKLAKIIEQLKVSVSSTDSSAKRKELKQLILILVDLNCNSQLQSHREFPSYIGPSIDALIKHCDSKESDIRLASDEALSRIIKALIPTHSNRVLVELCRQIKKNESPRVLKLVMTRFADLCHHARPQKQRAYLANLLNAISNIAARKEETLHEILAYFIQKVFSVMGIFAFENESKSVLKMFLQNLKSESATVRRSAAISITAIISTNRKSETLLGLVTEYLIDQILLNEEKTHETSVIIGTLITLKMIVPLYSTSLKSDKKSQCTASLDLQFSVSTEERIFQIFELSIYYSAHPSDHNVSNAALELLLQLLKLRRIILAIPALKLSNETLWTRISSSGLLKPNNQWNVSPIPLAEESVLVEQEVALKTLAETFDGSGSTDVASSDDDETTGYVDVSFADSKSANCSTTEEVRDRLSLNEENEEPDRSDDLNASEQLESTLLQAQEKILDAGTLKFGQDCSPLIFAARHISYRFLLTTKKGELKSDRVIRVSTKCLALHCLSLLGAIEPNIWNTLLFEGLNEKDSISITDTLLYRTHDDPQIRGQIGLLACSILQGVAGGLELHLIDVPTLMRVIEDTLKDRETSSSRLVLQGLQLLFPVALESPLCSSVVSLLLTLLDMSSTSYWRVKVDLIEVFSSLPWSALKSPFVETTKFNVQMFETRFIKDVLIRLIGDDDHRVRNAVADCIPAIIISWTTENDDPVLVRLQSFQRNQSLHSHPCFAGIPVTTSNLAEAYREYECNNGYINNLKFFVKLLFEEMTMSRSKFSKIGSIQALAALSSVYRPIDYIEPYGCEADGSCDLLNAAVGIMNNSSMMLDLGTHQALLTLTGHLYAGCVKASLYHENGNVTKDWLFLSSHLSTIASDVLSHVFRVLNCFCCVTEDINPLSQATKPPLVTLPSASALSPIRRKSKPTEPAVGGAEKDEKVEKEELARKWSKPSQLQSQQNLGYFASYPLYIKLYDLLRATYSTCKFTFDAVTLDRLSKFIKSLLDVLCVILEVGTFHDVGRYSDELLSYLRWIITFEPIGCLYSVQQLLKSLFGANLASFWQENSSRNKRLNSSNIPSEDCRKIDLHYAFGLGSSRDSLIHGISQKSNTSRRHEKVCLIVKFRTTVGKMGAEKTALSAHIRLFEPLVIKALKLYTITSSAAVQKQVLDLLCELIHLRVNYRMLDADKVFLNFVIQQFEFLEEGYIPDVEILLPSMFRFLALLSYDQYHSKTIIGVPRIMQLSGGLMAAGKDTQRYVLPTLKPMVEDLFLSKERKSDDSKELDTQKEVLINTLLRLIQYHQVFPLLSVILTQVHSESVVKWRLLSKQVCDVIVPQLYNHTLNLDSIDALVTLQTLFSNLDSPVVHESLLGLLQVFASSPPDDIDGNKSHRLLASRLAVLQILATMFDEAFLLDCLNEFNLTYLVDRKSDPLNVTPTEIFSAQRILSSLLVSTLKSAIFHWKLKVDRNRISPSFISWETDKSFDVYLLLELISLFQYIKFSGQFPVLQVTMFDELSREERSSSLLQLCYHLIPNNPVVCIKLCSLLPREGKLMFLNQNLFSGCNGSIAKHGILLAVCEEIAAEDLKNSNFFNGFAHEILLRSGEPSVKKLLEIVFEDLSLTKEFLDHILTNPFELQVKHIYQLLVALESKAQPVGTGIIELLAIKLTKLDSFLIHHKFKRIIKTFCEINGCSQLLIRCKSHIESAPISRYYTDLFSNSPERMLEKTNENCFRLIDKNFVLNFAAKSFQKQFDWEKVFHLLDRSDFDALLNLEYHPKDILLSSFKLNPDLFHATLASFFQKLKEESSTREISQTALLLVQLINKCLPSDLESVFTSAEISELSRLSLVFLASMNGIQDGIVLTYSTSEIIFRLESKITSEWTKKEHLPLLLQSVEAVEKFVLYLSKGKGLNHPEFLHFSVSELDENIMNCARSLGRMIVLLERDKFAFCASLHKCIRIVLVAICQVPLFYSYVCIPPALWSRGWTPQTKLDMDGLALDIPTVPSAFLHDEAIFEQFLFRIDLIGWISRQKFEEVWMTLLGIINLQNEEDCRPEEKASIVLATCKAVRAITMIIQKNLSLLSSPINLKNSSKRIVEFMESDRGQKISILFNLLPLDKDNPQLKHLSHKSYHLVIFNTIEKNLSLGSPSKKQSSTLESITHVDVHSCVYFLKDLYSQWLQSPDTSCALVTEVLRSLYEISNFFTNVSSFEWMFDCANNILKHIQQDDPQSLESALAKCIIKSAAFIPLNADSWEIVRKHCENSLNSQYIKTRSSTLGSLLFLLQRLVANPDQSRATSLVNLILDYASKYLGTEKTGLEWHQSWLWTLAFYLAEHFPDLPFRNYLVIDFVVQCALNGLLENNFQSIGLHQQILQGIERLCFLGAISLNKRKLIKMEVVNLLRNFDRESILLYALRTLLALVYTDFTSQLYKPGADPESMLLAMEWVESLFYRMKRGTDCEASIIGQVMPSITNDMFSPADVLNRVLSEFISARPAVARSLTPTIFKVFATARKHDQQSLVFEWILFSLASFTRAAPGAEAVAAWNILCFFTAASENPWLQAVFPSISRPMNPSNVAEVRIFVAAAIDFRSQLDPNHQSTMISTFDAAKHRSPFFSAVVSALAKV